MQVTVSYRGTEVEWECAKKICKIPTFKLRKREDVNWEMPVLLVTRSGLRVRIERREFRWHPGLLHTRLAAGWNHPLVRAMSLQPGDHVLDCTLGMGTDAAFLAALTGRAVTAFEMNPAVALMTNEGLTLNSHCVDVIVGDSRRYLSFMPNNAVDVIQGDPMFPAGTGRTHSLDLIREIGQHEPLGLEWLRQAKRVARKRVVVRDTNPGQLLETMKPDEVLAGRRGRPRYGIWFSRTEDGA